MTEKLSRTMSWGRTRTAHLPGLIVTSGATMLLLLAGAVFPLQLSGQAASRPASQFPMPGAGFGATKLELPPLPTPVAITPNGSIAEDVIARVNDQIITRSEYERAEEGLLQDAQQQNVSQAEFNDHLKNLLRDMIDQQLLLSKGKELGITGDAETIRQLDELRKQNHLDSMEALEKAAAQQGVSFEDFKQHIRNQAITSQVVRDEVGRRLNLTQAQEAAYYNAHAKEFEVPEQVHLSEILIPTPENATDAQLATAQATAEGVEEKLKGGANFADVAKKVSGGPTASAGGDLGDFKRGDLHSDVLENATFSLQAGGNTAPIRTRQGFVILHVDSHQAAGVPPLSAVEPQVEQAIYQEQMAPALRAYLTKARQDAYLDIKPGFVDTGSPRKETRAPDFSYTSYTPPPVKKKYQNKQRAEQAKATKAQAELATAREKVAEKAAAVQSSTPGVKNASMSVKRKKIRREKIRFGEAPRNALPAAPAAVATTTGEVGGQAAGVAMAPTESITSITTGTGADVDEGDPLAPKAGPEHKTRFAAHETQAEEARAKVNLAKAEQKATIRPVAATQSESASEKVQAAPLGLNGDTVKKPKKAKKQKGAPVERLQEKPKPDTTPVPVAPTVNPTLSSPAATAPSAPSSATPGSDRSVLPSAAAVPPGSSPAAAAADPPKN